MKRKGFTLIELLAVIVVLAIIALIATPIVMNVIKNAQKGAAERSAERYIDAVETAIATDRLENDLIADGTYNIVDGQLEGTTLDIEVSGDYPKSGTIVIEKGQVVATGTSMTIGDYTVTINDKGSATATAAGDVVALLDCTLVSGTANTVGAKYSCDFGAGARNFYVLEVGSDPVTGTTLQSNEVALILEGNYDMTTQAWCDQSGTNPTNNVCAADGLDAKLDEIAGAWTKLNRSQIGLPSAAQVVAADGQDEDAYLDFAGLSNGWLYSYPDYAEWSEGMNPPYGYWTSTPFYSMNPDHAWLVYCSGYLRGGRVDSDGDFGVRPVVNLAI